MHSRMVGQEGQRSMSNAPTARVKTWVWYSVSDLFSERKRIFLRGWEGFACNLGLTTLFFGSSWRFLVLFFLVNIPPIIPSPSLNDFHIGISYYILVDWCRVRGLARIDASFAIISTHRVAKVVYILTQRIYLDGALIKLLE
jgi:hypothetical protein